MEKETFSGADICQIKDFENLSPKLIEKVAIKRMKELKLDVGKQYIENLFLCLVGNPCAAGYFWPEERW